MFVENYYIIKILNLRVLFKTAVPLYNLYIYIYIHICKINYYYIHYRFTSGHLLYIMFPQYYL